MPLFNRKKNYPGRTSSPIGLSRNSSMNQPDLGLIIGLVIASLFLLSSLVLGLSNGSVSSFFSLVLVLVALGAASLVNFSLTELRAAWKALVKTTYHDTAMIAWRVQEIIHLSQWVRRDGVLVLEREATRIRDPFLRRALELAVDSNDERDLRQTLELEARVKEEATQKSVMVFQTLGTYAPAMGLIGTILGLIQMLNSLDSPDLVGGAMAVALMTTLYGAILANLVFLPLSGKIAIRAAQEALLHAVTIQGVLGLSKQENPIFLEQKLRGLMPTTAVGS